MPTTRRKRGQTLYVFKGSDPFFRPASRAAKVSRRAFLKGAAAAGAGLALGPAALGAPAPPGQSPATAGQSPAPPKSDDLHVAIIGAGMHGRELITHALKVPGVRFKAVCDIWPYNLQYALRRLKAYRHDAAGYGDFRDMLAARKDLDAVLIATPDAFHAEQTVACLKAGLHVYCEKEMHQTIAGCREMVRAARQAGRLLQVGRQHRSNPRYHRALDYIYGKKALGRITHVSGWWHGHKRQRADWPKGSEIDPAVLKAYGFGTMERFRSWRWLEQFSGGPIANLGSHQIDVFNWLLRAPPKAVYASGGLDYYDMYEWYDNVCCVFEWDYAWDGRTATVRGTYEVLTTAEQGGFVEMFHGDEGTLALSEDASRTALWREIDAPAAPWEQALAEVEDTDALTRAYLPEDLREETRPVYQCHLENFFEAVRGTARLACPGEVGLEAAVSALKVNEAMKAGRRLAFGPEEFKA